MSGKDLKELHQDLPKNWEVFHSKKSNRLYYYNNVTRKTQWQHPSLGEKNHKHDEKSKKRKAPAEKQDILKDEKTKQPNQKQERTTQQPFPVKKEKEKTDSAAVLSKSTSPKPLKLTRLPLKFTIKKRTETAKTNFQAPKPVETAHTNRPQAPKSAVIAHTNPQAPKPCNKQKPPALVRSKSEVVVANRKITKLQPLTRPKSVGEGSDSGVSDSSDRILAWLADTSRFNFKNHPVPNAVIEEKTPTSEKRKLLVEKQSERKAGKQKTEKQKVAILERVGTSSEATKQKSDTILDKLLPKHPHTHVKQRYTPYKLTLPNSKQNKRLSDQPEQVQSTEERNAVETNNPKASNTVKNSDSNPTTNENGLSPDLANCVERNFCREPTPVQNGFLAGESGYEHSSQVTGNNTSINVRSLGTVAVNNMQNGLNESQQCVSEEVQRQQYNEVLQHEDEVFSMEEGAGSVVSVPLSENDIVDMEIDNAEEFAKEIVKELKQMRGSVVVLPSKIPKDIMAMQVSSEGYEGALYIVLDTNVLLSHLKFVVELKDFPIPEVGMPILVIPWIVIQELDSLKENKWKCHDSAGDDSVKTTRVDMLARNAIKFLNSSFQQSDPRVRGQTVEEAAEHVGNLEAETNDDKILQCCLLFNERAQNGSCVLFSNDVNLCNKAMVNGIKAFNHQKLLPGLKDLFQCGAIVKQHSEEYNIQLAKEQEQARRRQKADDILCELQIILREGLSYIIESEMKKAYDDLWLDILHIKPPWTLIDVLQLLDKHWIAVFGHVLKRDRKTLIDKLRQKFDDKKGIASSLQFCSEMLQLALELFQSFAAHSNYDDAMPKCLAAVNVLVQKCQQFQAGVSMNSANGQPTKCLTYPTNMNDTVENNNCSENLESSASSGFLHEEVANTFNLIWTAVTQFSTQIFTALGYPNTISDGSSQDYPKASKDEAISFLHVLCPKLLNLVHCIQNVLRDPWEKVSQNNTLFIQLEQTITVFLNVVLSQENKVTAEKLFCFCQDASMRTSLVQGLSQLDRASAMLQHCASCIAQSSAMSQTSEI